MTRVAFQGELGAFSEEAVRVLFGRGAEPVACREFADVGGAVVGGEVEYGLLPVENTLAGSVVAAYDVLATQPLEIVGEVVTPIHHCVLGVPGARLDGLSRVLSHPVALAQCTRFCPHAPACRPWPCTIRPARHGTSRVAATPPWAPSPGAAPRSATG